jgi:thioredoxin-related protein
MRLPMLLVTLGLAIVTGAALVGAGVMFGKPVRSLNAGAPLAAIADEAGRLPAPEMGEDGLWTADWYRPTSGDLLQDAKLAAAEGRMLAVFWERRGCEFCALLHNEALRLPVLHAYVSQRFYVVRLNFHGTMPIRDFDGELDSESEIASKHRAYGTPTLEFRTADGKEVLRIPGYVPPKILQSAFEFVDTGAYAQSNINAWLKAHDLL